MKKNLFLLAAAAITFAGCSNDEYMGTVPNVPQEGQGGAITFSGRSGSITRADFTGENAAQKLDYRFNVYGVKVLGNGSQNVFAHTTEITLDDNETYNVWWPADDANNASTTNEEGWEYVGASGLDLPGELDKDVRINGTQTIKYWDYAASRYEFVAYANTVGRAKVTNVTSVGFDVEGAPDDLATFFIADKKTMTKPTPTNTKYGVVTLKFRSSAAKVRLGIYETIPGYEVKDIKFHADVDATDGTAAAVLKGSFPSSGEQTMTVTYDASDENGNGISKVVEKTDYTPTATFNFGKVEISDEAPMKDVSSDPTWAYKDGASAGSFINVFTNTEHNAAMLLKVDYTLKNGASGETIEVKGATAAVPAEYMKWLPNHAYTYLFKITDNTNGTTGGTGDVVGLYPIVFDAMVEETVAADGEGDGTITTVSQNAHITTYAEGSVSASGITYTTASNIYATLSAEDGELIAPTEVGVYNGKEGLTEADLVAEKYTGEEVESAATIVTEDTYLNVGSNDTHKFTLPASKHAKLSLPTAGTYYVKFTVTTPNGGDEDVTSTYYKVIVVASANN